MEEYENWLQDEIDKIKENSTTEYENIPSLKLQENVITEITIDFSKPFEKWTGEQNGKTITKKIIPCTVNGVRMNWWLNVQNPIYSEILKLGNLGITNVKILQTGNQGNTKYLIVK
ncbi:MAG: hypothetical protein EOL97_07160 [Spirochaetia bacterium]|nr:hypothetical protein [Spirochaetia bacterium]